MNPRAIFATMIALTPLTTMAQTEHSLSQWEDTLVLEQNTLKAHAAFMPYSSTEAMMADARYEQPWLMPTGADFLPLDGNRNLSIGSTTDDSLYCRRFSLPAGWTDKHVVLHFDSICGATYVWVNGRDIGFSRRVGTSAEFDVSKWICEGENDISVQVLQHQDGSLRDIYLYATPLAFIYDYDITAMLDSTANYRSGVLDIGLSIENKESGAATKTFEAELRDADGNIVKQASETICLPPPIPAMNGIGAVRSLEYVPLFLSGLSGLRLWSAEDPQFYTVIIRQRDGSGREEMVFATRYAFHHIEQQ